ncbi:MAG: hypothetical protein LBV30_02935 [Propionibacteriaceae bacterium]|jgi:hypothetical protein|nr:hypothetical protein [Propionibacteriaceae bacterium]
MSRLKAVLIVAVCVALAAVISWTRPDTTVQPVAAQVGQTVSLQPGLTATVTGVALTRSLTGAIDRHTESVYLVVDVDLGVTSGTDVVPHLMVSSGGRTLVPGFADLALPRFGEAGFVSHCRVPILMETADLIGAQAQIEAVPPLVSGFHRQLTVDLGLDAGRVEALLTQADEPIQIDDPVVEVLR